MKTFHCAASFNAPNAAACSQGAHLRAKPDTIRIIYCQPGCRFRHRAEDTHELFEKELRKFIPHPAIKEIYKIIVGKLFSQFTKPENDQRRKIADDIDRLNQKISKARNLLLSEVIDANDFKALKDEAENEIKKAERLSNTIGNNKPSQAHVEKLMDKAISTLSRLDVHYGNLPVSKKRELIGSIFPEKIVFDGINYRTPKVNEAARLIYMINSDLYSTKNRKGHKSAYLSGQVESPGI